MSHNGYRNDHTYAVAVAADNTRDFYFGPRAAISELARTGDTAEAAARLRQQVVDERALANDLGSWVDLGQVDWAEIVTAWASGDE